VQYLVTIGSRRTSRHPRVISRCCAFVNHNPSIPSLFFLRTSTGRTPGPMLMVDGLNDASWPKEVPFEYVDAKKILLGGLWSQNCQFFDSVGNSHLKR